MSYSRTEAQELKDCNKHRFEIDTFYSGVPKSTVVYRYYLDTVFALENKKVIVNDSLRFHYDKQKITKSEERLIRDLIVSCFSEQRKKVLKQEKAKLFVTLYIGQDSQITELKFTVKHARGNNWVCKDDLICMMHKLKGTCIVVPEAFMESPYYKLFMPIDFTKKLTDG